MKDTFYYLFSSDIFLFRPWFSEMVWNGDFSPKKRRKKLKNGRGGVWSLQSPDIVKVIIPSCSLTMIANFFSFLFTIRTNCVWFLTILYCNTILYNTLLTVLLPGYLHIVQWGLVNKISDNQIWCKQAVIRIWLEKQQDIWTRCPL